MTVDRSFWSARRVLLTGHTGFKGSWMSLWLQMMGCDLYGLAKAPSTTPSMFGLLSLDRGMTSVIGDVTDNGLVEQVVRDVKPEIVIHMAAQPLVRQSYTDPVETYATNVMGTVNLLSAMRSQSFAKRLTGRPRPSHPQGHKFEIEPKVLRIEGSNIT